MSQILNLIKNPITYKILIDIFFITLLIAGGFIITETLLPGLISAYISPFILFVSIFVIIIFISLTAKQQKIHTNIVQPNKFLLSLFVLLFVILISIAGLSYGYFFDSIVIIFSTAILMLLYSLFTDLLHKY